MAKGRKPKPTAVKVAQGMRADRVNRAEPKPAACRPEMPVFVVDPVAVVTWGRLIPMLEAMGVLTVVDGFAAGVYCNAVARCKQAADDLALNGPSVFTEDGGSKSNPAVAAIKSAEDTIAKFGAMLGLDPSSRSKLVAKPETPKDDLADFLGGNRA